MREPLPCSTIAAIFQSWFSRIVRVADLQLLGARFPVVDDHVVGAFHVVAVEKDEATRHRMKRVPIDAIDRFNAAGRIELQQRRGDRLHIL